MWLRHRRRDRDDGDDDGDGDGDGNGDGDHQLGDCNGDSIDHGSCCDDDMGDGGIILVSGGLCGDEGDDDVWVLLASLATDITF
eukprot:2105944-Rhodomonas_salina.1